VDSHVHCKSSKILVAFITRHAGSKTLLQQDPPVLNSKCRLTQVVLYNGGQMVAKLGCESKPMEKYILSSLWHKNHQKTQFVQLVNFRFSVPISFTESELVVCVCVCALVMQMLASCG